MHRSSSLLILGLVSLLAIGCDDGADDDAAFEYRGSDLCSSGSDQAIVGAHLADGGVLDGGVPDGGLDHPNSVSRDCAVVCIDEILMQGDVEGCMQTCLAGGTLGGLSEGCTGCFIDGVLCGQEYCVSQCLTSSGDVCSECMETHCFPGQRDCTGIPEI